MILELPRVNMDTNPLNDLPGLNCLLEKHKQMQERSAFKSQLQQSHSEISNGTNITGYHNPYPMLQNTAAYYNPNPMLPNGYFNSNPMLQFANNYYNPTPALQPTLQPANNFYQPNPMIQYPNSYYNPNSMLQCSNGYYNPTSVNNFFNSNNYYNPNSYPIPPGMTPVSAINYQVPQEMPPISAMHCQIPQGIHSFAAMNYQVPQTMPPMPPVHYQVPQVTLPVPTVNYQLPQQTPISNGNYHIPQEPPPVSTGKVYLNPNYNKNKVTQANSQKPLIHINPKLMKLIPSISESKCNVQPSSNNNSNVSENVTDTPNINTSIQDDSFKTSTPVTCRKSPETVESNTNAENKDDGATKNCNSSLVVLTRRKLVRVKKNSKPSGITTNPFKSGYKKMKSPKRKSLSLTNQLYNINNLKYVRNIDPCKTKWCNQTLKYTSSVNNKNSETVKVIPNTSVGLVSIDGVFYKKSRNKLVRSNSVTTLQKRKRSSTSSKDVQYYIAKNGKKLQKLDLTKERNNSSLLKLSLSISPVKNYKTNASNKAKQRSLQILRSKMRKNNQPCLLFQKFGYCANQSNGTCAKVHDKKQVAVCRNFLQGKCLLTECPLSHDIGPEKMPTCKYFLEGCCTREGCPYLHVKVSSKKPICVEFLRGYCPQGNECQNRHIFACPEFDKSSSCSKGKFCPYPHKSILTETKKRGKKGARPTRKIEASAEVKQCGRKSPAEQPPQEVEIKKRYYDETSEDLSQKREKLLRQVNIMKEVQAAAHSSELPSAEEPSATDVDQSATGTATDSRESEQTVEVLCNRPKRPPIGPLPAYIPIE